MEFAFTVVIDQQLKLLWIMENDDGRNGSCDAACSFGKAIYYYIGIAIKIYS